MRSTLILLRHAAPVIPAPVGPDDYTRPLTTQGHQQARNVIDELRTLTPHAIASSPYLRAIQTVQPLARSLDLLVRTDDELREWDSGLEPRPDYARHYALSWTMPRLARAGGESLDQLSRRAVGALLALAHQHHDDTVVVGSHGTFIARALVGLGLTQVDCAFRNAMPMPAIYRLDVTDHRVQTSGPGLTGP
ncbi:histidine phosphatase family protein [Nocardia rhizosphaerihabitans]|uniref:Phosphoglycerate mutase n=1 Tax=Nocardia rhizosphaerihabitans TaxID=1691570 RepID=A0ABQ2L1B3_9NOCA|nr:histidine phosphatase family protein [Nocardia rhizosphaerihabitans]GGN99426.1 phosphoglycerate mutase [Nocardia rhizosphaerihabitans]